MFTEVEHLLKKAAIVLTISFLVLIPAGVFPGAAHGQKWQGTDKVIEELASKMGGAKARPPLLNTDQGDLLLFLFAVGGFAAGVIVGVNWDRLFRRKEGSCESADVPDQGLAKPGQQA